MRALVRARGQIMFLIGLILATAVVLWLDRQESVPVSDIEPASTLVYTPPSDAAAAWAWFESNTDPETGLLRSGADAGLLLKATIAAHRLGMINGRELYRRLHRTLGTLQKGRPALDAAPTLESALELIQWSYPANSGQAARVLQQLRAAPARHSGAAVPPASEAGRWAEILVRAALQERGDK